MYFSFFPGDVFHMNTLRTWEFNSSFPIRSVVPIYLTSGIPLLLLKLILSCFSGWLPSAYSVLIVPRIFMLILSFTVDFHVYKMASCLGSDRVGASWIVASSYVAVVYYTRTFSNALESFCMKF